MNIQQLIAPALAYFAIVFGIGFLLGSIRVLWLVPQLGVRYAELAEMPIMLLAIFFAARWVTQYFAVPPTISSRLVVGLSALICLLLVEFTVVLWLQGISIAESFANRDPISGAAYMVSLILFALMPLLVNR
jgi:disulfide bond formation protein DsbB